MAVKVPIVLQCGADWWMQFVYADAVTGAPVAVTSPRMEIRQNVFGAAISSGTVLYSSETQSPTIVLTQPSTNVVLATILGSVTKNLLAGQVGSWDAYAIDPAGAEVLLGSGTFTSVPNVTAL